MHLINPLNWPYKVVSRIPLLALLSLLLLGSRSVAQETPVRIPFEPTVTYGEGYGEQAVAQQAQTRFDLKLFDQLLQQQPQENLFFSPLSIRLALSMVYNGASGETQAAIAEVLEAEELSLTQLNWANAQLVSGLVEKSQLDENNPIQVQIANGLWVDQAITFRPQFLQALASYYQAVVNRVNLGSRQTVQDINTWVKERTQGKIDRIVERLSRDDLMVLINAISFKGRWTQPFDPDRTQLQPFTLPGGKRVKVPMMTQSGRYGYLETERLQVVRLPYGEGEMEMLILLPKEGVDPEALRAELNPETWGEWTGSLRSRAGSVRIPRFNLAYETDLIPTLRQLGMGIAFSGGADFSQMTSEPAQISQVLHKAVIEVNEEGSEAAAVTGVIISRTAIDREEPFQLVVDRPFWFAIRDTATQTILFMGSVVDPQ
ncbi:serpin family protein [Thermostichus vulcanus]|uniref:Serpin family protein n=1 Tax=Thermostichus vulcanus str. 'Rupite' TaxID=2813851 RepID=A0ABT0C6V8_THEVL|nr:serpin family protein [Thermostichus vulcanus]MCJ2541528.1 serpin family protein [Thermostichus vulcanus str. 'Rupite']